MEIGVLYLSHAMLVLAELMLNEGVCMHPSEMVLAYCDESLSYIWKSRGLM